MRSSSRPWFPQHCKVRWDVWFYFITKWGWDRANAFWLKPRKSLDERCTRGGMTVVCAVRCWVCMLENGEWQGLRESKSNGKVWREIPCSICKSGAEHSFLLCLTPVCVPFIGTSFSPPLFLFAFSAAFFSVLKSEGFLYLCIKCIHWSLRRNQFCFQPSAVVFVGSQTLQLPEKFSQFLQA